MAPEIKIPDYAIARSGIGGAVAYDQQQKQYEEAIRHIAINNPELRKDPVTIGSLASQYGHKAEEVSKAIKLARIHALTQRSLLGNINHWFDQVGQSANNLSQNIDPFRIQTYKNLYRTANQFSSAFGNALWNAGKSIVNVPVNFARTLASGQVAQSPQDVGFLGPSWLRQVEEPFANLGKMAGDYAMMVAQTPAYYMSKVKRDGVGAATGEAAVSLLLGWASDGLLNRAVGFKLDPIDMKEASGALWGDKINQQIAKDREFVESAKDWPNVTPEMMVELSRAQTRLKVLSPQNINLNVIDRLINSKSAYDRHVGEMLRSRYGGNIFTDADIERLARSKDPMDRQLAEDYRRAYNKPWDPKTDINRPNPLPWAAEFAATHAEYIGRVLRSTYNAAHGLNKILGSVPAQVFYLSSAAIASENDPDLWEQARFGNVVLPNGKISTLGAEIANMLNFKSGFFHDIIAGAINIDLNFIVDDPLTSMLRISALRKSQYGYTGTLGRLYGGLGIRHVGDVRRAYFQYSSVRRAVDWISKHTGSEILQRFGGTFNAKMAHDLGKASSPEAVLSIMEEVAAGIEMVFAEMPTMSWYTLFKTALVGDLGEKFGTLGGLLEREIGPTLEEARQVKEQTGLDVLPPTVNYQRLNAAGKSRVLWRQRLRKQFLQRARWMNERTGVETVRDIAVGSVNAIPAIMNRLEEVNVSRLRARAFGDQLLEAASNRDFVGYKRAYRSMMYEVITREIAPMMPRAEFEPFMMKIEEFIWSLIDDMIGVDGAGLEGWFVANSNENWNIVRRADDQLKHAGIASSHLGNLYLPEATKLRRLQRQLAVMVTEMTSSEAEKALTDVIATEQHLYELAEKTTESIEKAARRWQAVYDKRVEKGPATFETENVYNGYKRAFKHNMVRYRAHVLDETMPGLNRAQRVAAVVVEMQNDIRHIEQMIMERTAGLEKQADFRVTDPATGELSYNPAVHANDVPNAEERAMYRELEELEGERQAIRMMMTEVKSRLNESPFSLQAIEELANLSATQTKLVDEAKNKWVRDFKQKFLVRSEGKVKAFGVLTVAGKRGLRSNREIISDFFQFYINNRYFKPMALTSPAWATRVSLSEMMLNSLRIGGFNYFEAWVASGIAKQELRLGKQAALDKEEQSLIRNVVGGIMLGIDRGLLDGMSDPRKQRLVQDAVELMVASDGHLKMGVHGHRDSIADDAAEDGMVESSFGIDKNGDVTQRSMRRGAHERIDASSEGAGTAMHESMVRAANDPLLGPISRHMYSIVHQRGSELFDAAADVEYRNLYRRAVTILRSRTSFINRNKILDAQREALMASEDFERASIVERDALLAELDAANGDIEKIISDQIPKSMRASYEATARSLAKVVAARDSLAAQIETLQENADVLAGLERPAAAKAELKGLQKEISDQIKAIDKQIKENAKTQKELAKKLDKHPYADMVRKLEGGRALSAYKAIQNELIDELLDNSIRPQIADTSARLTELFGDQKVVVPRGGYVELANERFLAFTDGEGNPVPNSEIWQSLMENYPQLWSENERFASHLPLGTPGVEGYDALAHVLGIKPTVFANYSVSESGRAAFIEDYARRSKVIRSRKASGQEKAMAERWMHENVGSRRADWRLKGEDVWDRRVGLGEQRVLPPHGLTISEWFEEAMMMTDHLASLKKAEEAIVRGQHSVAYEALRQIDPTMSNSMRSAPRLYPDGASFEEAFSVRDVPLSFILGPDKTSTKALSDLAFHLRQRSELIDSRVFDKNFIPHYTPDETGRQKFIADFQKASDTIREYEKLVREVERLVDRNVHRKAMREQWMRREKERIEAEYPVGWSREENFARIMYPHVSVELALVLKRLATEGKMALVRDLKLGEHIVLTLPVGPVDQTIMLDALWKLDLPTYDVPGRTPKYRQADGLPGEEVTDTSMMTYAEAGEAYQRAVDALNGTGRIKDDFYGRIDAYSHVQAAKRVLYRAGYRGNYHLDEKLKELIEASSGERLTEQGPLVPINAIEGFESFGSEFTSKIIDGYAHVEAHDIVTKYFEKFAAANGDMAEPQLSAAAEQLRELLGYDEFPSFLKEPDVYGLNPDSIVRIAAENGSANALDHLSTTTRFGNFVPLQKRFAQHEIPDAMFTERDLIDHGNYGDVFFVEGMPIVVKQYPGQYKTIETVEEAKDLAYHEIVASEIAKAVDAPIRDTAFIDIAADREFPAVYHPVGGYADTDLQTYSSEISEILGDGWNDRYNTFQGTQVFEAISGLPPQAAEDLRSLAIYDALTGMTDRHFGNLISIDNRIVGIDNDIIGTQAIGEWKDRASEILESVLATREEVQNFLDRLDNVDLSIVDGTSLADLPLHASGRIIANIKDVCRHVLKKGNLREERPAFTGSRIDVASLDAPPAPVTPGEFEFKFSGKNKVTFGEGKNKAVISTPGLLDLIRKSSYEEIRAMRDFAHKQMGGGSDVAELGSFRNLSQEFHKIRESIVFPDALKVPVGSGLPGWGMFGLTEHIYRNTDGSPADFARELNKDERLAIYDVAPGGKWNAKNVEPLIEAINDVWDQAVRLTGDTGRAFAEKAAEFERMTGIKMPNPSFYVAEFFMKKNAHFIFEDERKYNALRSELLGGVVPPPPKMRMAEPAFKTFEESYKTSFRVDGPGPRSLDDIVNQIMSQDYKDYDERIFLDMLGAAALKHRIDAMGSGFVSDIQSAAKASGEIAEIAKPRFKPAMPDGTQMRAVRSGKPPVELNMLYSDPANTQHVANMRKTFTANTMKKMLGVKPLDKVEATAHIKRLESFLKTNKKYANVSLSYDDGIRIDSFSYDPASPEGRKKAIETIKAICDMADTYKMRVKVRALKPVSTREETVSEIERRMDAWYASFGFSSSRVQVEGEYELEKRPGMGYWQVRHDYIEFTRKPTAPGTSSLVEGEMEDMIAGDEFVNAGTAAEKGAPKKAKKTKKEPIETRPPLKKPSDRHLRQLEEALDEGYIDDEEFEAEYEAWREAMEMYEIESNQYRIDGFDPKTGKKKIAANPDDVQSDEGRVFGQKMSPYWVELNTDIIPPELEEAQKQARKWMESFVTPFGFERPSPSRVWQRAIDIERTRVASTLDRQGYYELQDQSLALSKEAAKLGRERRKLDRSVERLPGVDEIQDRNVAASIQAQDELQAKREKLEGLDERISQTTKRREKQRTHVLRQNAKAREREAERIVKFYDRRIRNENVGKSGLVKKYLNRTGTLNTQIEREVSRMADRRILQLGAQGFSGTDGLADLHQQLSDFAYAQLMTLSPEELARYERSVSPLADEELTSGDAMTDFANTIATHLLGITSSSLDKQLFGDIVQQIGTGELMGPRSAAKWLGNRKAKGLSLPGPFPERRFVSPFEKGSNVGLMNKISDLAHQKILGKIVNELVREPVFVWEYHLQMEELRPLVERGIMTHDQAMVKAQMDASVNMMKFVHNPQDKLVWENNWRVLAPFYFAKNQALRRAFRMAGDNLAAFEKYLKINLAVTDFVAQVTSATAQSYNIPGSQLIAQTTNTVVGAYLSLFGYNQTNVANNFGFDASPSSVTSIVITGMVPGAEGLLEELVHIPFGINFTVPAKLIYTAVGQKNGTAYAMLQGLVGDVGMRSSLWEDLLPNSLLRNTIKGITGVWQQDSAGSYQSQETWVMTDTMDQIALGFYVEAKKKYPTLDSDQLLKYGSKEELWTHYAMQEMSRWLKDRDNMQWLQDRANNSTALMWALKTIISWVAPVAINIGERFYDRNAFYEMANKRDENGELIYPTLQLASNAYMIQHPESMYAMMPHTASTGNPYPETTHAGQFINDNEVFVKKFSLMAPFFIKSGGEFDSNALRLEYSLNLRERITPPEFKRQLQVMTGDRYYAQLELQYRMNPMYIDRTNDAGIKYLEALLAAKSYDERLKVANSKLGIGAQLTWDGYRALDKDARLYGMTMNTTWASEHYGGKRRELADRTYTEFKSMIKDPLFRETVGDKVADRYESFLRSITAYREAYALRLQNNLPTNDLKEAWYSWCTAQAIDPANEDYAGFIYSVLRKVPDPMPDPFDRNIVNY